MRVHRPGFVALAVLAALSGGCGGAAPAPGGAGLPAPPGTGKGPLAGKVVVLDPGHNGGNAAHPEQVDRQVDIITKSKACNAVGFKTADGYEENAFAWSVTQHLRPLLETMGAQVVLTRSNDEGIGPCVTERAAIGNEARADAVVSIHGDSGKPSGHGFHVITPGLIAGRNDEVIEPSRKLGLAIRDAYRDGTGMPYANYRGEDGLRSRTDLGGLNLSTRPVVFIECGNMRNAGDAAKMTDVAFRKRIADSLAKGIKNYLTGA
ncbi:N-acetylmuramoyl-L-alanine amidase [Nonomuraea sp. NPDC049625]|uniref:N-acetylmuramoyl-L-alanine amidase n=1 Tax=Nonomuraea sp. NPDC049625 TaxID=3155775 RepID=UPI00343BAFCD